MTAVLKAAFCLELVVCFGPAMSLLILGVMMLPLWVASLGVAVLKSLGLVAVVDSGPGGLWASLVLIGAVVTGVFGVLGVARLVYLLLRPGGVLPRPYATLGLVIAGILGLCLYNGVVQPTDLETEPVAFALLFALPLLGTAHLLYLARRSIWSPG